MATLYINMCPGGIPSWILLVKFALLLLYLFWEQYLIQRNAGFRSPKRIWNYLLNRPIEYNYLLLPAIILAYNVFLNIGNIGITCREYLACSPYFIIFRPIFSPRILLPILIFIVTIRKLIKWCEPKALSTKRFLGISFLVFIVQCITIGWIRSTDFSDTFQQFFNTTLEYTGAVVRPDTIPDLLQNYVRSMEALPFHARTHPPGPIIFLSLINSISFGSKHLISLFVVITGGLGILITYGFSSHILKDSYASRISTILFMYSPSIVLYNFLSLDVIVSLLIVFSIYLFHQSMSSFNLPKAIFTGIIFAFAWFFSFNSSYIFLYCAVYLVLYMIQSKSLPGRQILTCTIVAITFIVFYLTLYIGTDFDIISCFLKALRFNTRVMGSAWRSSQHYIFITTGNLVAFFTFCGIPISIIFLYFFLKKKYSVSKEVSIFSSTLLISMLLLNFLGLYQWEVERIWIFLMLPMLILSGHTLKDVIITNKNLGFSKFKDEQMILFSISSILFLQSIGTEIFFYTHW